MKRRIKRRIKRRMKAKMECNSWLYYNEEDLKADGLSEAAIDLIGNGYKNKQVTSCIS